MVGYIGSKAVTLSTTAADVAGDATIDGNLTVKGTTVTIDSAAVQEIKLGDNDKMTFGDATGGDLQIYHDGSNSRIVEAGTGNLVVQSDANTSITDAAGTIVSGRFRPSTHVSLYYNGSEKLATTSTGIDVTGTVFSDNMQIEASTSDRGIYWKRSSDNWTNAEIRVEYNGNYGGTMVFGTSPTGALTTTNTDRLKISNNGDISFYEDTGTTAKFFWDASAESLGIGTTSPTYRVHVEGTGDEVIAVTAGATSIASLNLGNSTNKAEGGIRYDNSSEDLIFRCSNTERARIDVRGNVGIGVTPSASHRTAFSQKALQIGNSGCLTNLDVSDSDRRTILFQNAILNSSGDFERLNTGYVTSYQQGSGTHKWFYAGSDSAGTVASVAEAMRIDSSGRLLVGKTASSSSTAGGTLEAGSILGVVSGGQCLRLNRLSSEGDIIQLWKDSAYRGRIGVDGNRTFIASYNGASGSGLKFTSGGFNAVTETGADVDNTKDVGSATYRFDDIYATNGTIQTSDQNEKQQIASLSDAEITAAKAISKLFKTFKWNDSVEEKGDAARTHTGVIAQEVEQAMTDAGLNAGDYAFFISTTWWETQTEVPAVEAVDAVYETQTDEEGNEVQVLVSEAVEAKEAYTRTDTYETAEEAPEGATERNRKGIRYPQLLSFIGAATEQRLASIESRLDALEGN